MSLSGMGEAMCVEGATDALAFEVYVEHFLAPTLKEGQVVVLDNLGAHRPQRIRELIEHRGGQLGRVCKPYLGYVCYHETRRFDRRAVGASEAALATPQTEDRQTQR